MKKKNKMKKAGKVKQNKKEQFSPYFKNSKTCFANSLKSSKTNIAPNNNNNDQAWKDAQAFLYAADAAYYLIEDDCKEKCSSIIKIKKQVKCEAECEDMNKLKYGDESIDCNDKSAVYYKKKGDFSYVCNDIKKQTGRLEKLGYTVNKKLGIDNNKRSLKVRFFIRKSIPFHIIVSFRGTESSSDMSVDMAMWRADILNLFLGGKPKRPEFSDGRNWNEKI
jgi:hypothetical protein